MLGLSARGPQHLALRLGGQLPMVTVLLLMHRVVMTCVLLARSKIREYRCVYFPVKGK